MQLVLMLRDICQEWGATPLYVCEFGSHLYGTSGPQSDKDYKCIFLPFFTRPSFDYCFSAKLPVTEKRAFNVDGGTLTQTPDIEHADIEVEFWSLQQWLNTFVKNGDTGAIDVLYSYQKPESIRYCQKCVIDIFENPLHFFDPKNTRAFLGYAIGQAQRYSIKGDRLNTLYKILEVFDITEDMLSATARITAFSEETFGMVTVAVIDDGKAVYQKQFSIDQRLYEWIPKIVEHAGHKSYCYIMDKMHVGQSVLQVLGKEHQGTIRIHIFVMRMFNDATERGHRSKKAAIAGGKDWKALSHALRVIDEVTELLLCGMITFPLPNAEYIRRVKRGDVEFDEVSQKISEGIIRVDTLRDETKIVGQYDEAYAKQCITYAYACAQ